MHHHHHMFNINASLLLYLHVLSSFMVQHTCKRGMSVISWAWRWDSNLNTYLLYVALMWAIGNSSNGFPAHLSGLSWPGSGGKWLKYSKQTSNYTIRHKHVANDVRNRRCDEISQISLTWTLSSFHRILPRPSAWQRCCTMFVVAQRFHIYQEKNRYYIAIKIK